MELEVGDKMEQKWPSWGRSEGVESNLEFRVWLFWNTMD